MITSDSVFVCRWAVSTVMTRQNILPSSLDLSGAGQKVGCLALIPFWDMCNHKQGEVSIIFSFTNRGGKSCMCDAKLRKVSVVYASITNTGMLVLCGQFQMRENSH